MNRQYLEYLPEVGIPAANSHHGQQHQLHKQPECKAANLSNLHDAETCSSWADHVGGSIRRILQDNRDLTLRELAEMLGMSVGRLNYCLNALIDKGFVKMGNFQKSKNKFKYVYLLTPQGIAEKVALTSRFLKRKMEEYDALKVEIEALKAEVGEVQTNGNKAHQT